MLVLTRKTGESIVINGEIEVQIIEIKGEQVRLGIKAPDEVKVYRKEIYSAILQENKQAANTAQIEKLQDLLKKMK
ncbi:carbon storage regulator CsrA [Fodinisporobacter ferrooxydans]|uniref:Translational regulator CsrA n=1 Tax=Fodinisporobacter ferrooxydans TaxID=2901836 RepID=A0ABY4CPC0_9BACL|nr:carbon storage regulator CsrA [Alicyclobacillaceae bacterium MYW30-H2]